MSLRVTIGDREFRAAWTGENPAVRAALEAELPVSRTAHRWGQEVYAPVPLDETPAATSEAVPVGAIAYWPDGPALCVFWGRTPASEGNEPRAASPVGVVARIEDTADLQTIDPSTGDLLRFDAVDEAH